MASETEHAADEAGGEVVYSSDGLAPLPTPESAGNDGAKSKGDSVPDGGKVGADMILDSAHVEASQAFEIFAGKIYPNQNKRNAAAAVPKKENETALERLARLQQEVTELEDDLKATQPQDESAQPLVGVIQDLKKRLEESNNQMRPSQEELTRLVHDQLQGWETKTKDTAASDAAANSGVIYELYGSKLSMDGEDPRNSTAQRLLQLEKVLGAAGAGTTTTASTSATSSTTTTTRSSMVSSSASKSILQRLEEMESTLDNLNETALEQAASKAKVIRADLEAASKARNKLLLASSPAVAAASSDKSGGAAQSSSTSTSAAVNNDSKTIAALYDQLQQLEGLSGHLPSLVDRLQQLATLHSQSATFSSRLVQSEKEIQQLNTTFTQLEQTFDKLESSTVQNLSTMEENIKQVDDRLKTIQ